jgi:hypothetical protein
MIAPRAQTRTAILAALSFVGAVVVGWHLAGDSEITKDPSVPSVKTRTAERPDNGRPAWLAGEIAQIREESSLAERMRRTINLANSIPDSDIFTWLKRGWFTMGEGFESHLFIRLLSDRLETVDPAALARLRLGERNSNSALDLLKSLAANDPEQVIALFREQPNDIVELQVLAEMAKFHSNLALERFIELSAFGFPEGESHDPVGVIRALAEADPAALEAALSRMSLSSRYDAENALIGHRLANSFDDEIQKLSARSDGWILLEQHVRNTGILEKLFNIPGELPPSWRHGIVRNKVWMHPGDPSVAKFWWNADLSSSGFNEQQIKTIRKGALHGIAYAAPENALPLLDAADLNASERKEMIQNVFSRAALSDSEAEKLLGLLKFDGDRQSAREQLDRKKQHLSR